MQNKYVGDVGDFGKYGLLRALSGVRQPGRKLTIGVVWYLTPDDDRPGGTLDTYLGPTPRNLRRFRDCDAQLYDRMGSIRREGHIAAVESARILGQGAVFFDEPLLQQTDRRMWLRRAMDAVRVCDLIFLDPDNGIRTEEVNGRSLKHAYLGEIASFATAGGKSVVVYHHLGRRGKHEAQINEKLAVLCDRFPERRPFAMWYHRGTSRVFFLIPAAAHKRALLERAERFVRGPWGIHGHLEPRVLSA